MEYVIVHFAKNRKVYIDGKKSGGTTNKIFRVGTGTHDFDIGIPLDYSPRQKRMVINGTNALAPAVIKFNELGS